MTLDPTVRDALPRFFGTGRPPAADPVAGARAWLERVAARPGPAPAEVGRRDVVCRRTATGRSGAACTRRQRPPLPVLVLPRRRLGLGDLDSARRQLPRARERRRLPGRLGRLPSRPRGEVPRRARGLLRRHRLDAEHATELDGDPRRIAVGGDSAGGNLAAVVALMARDKGGPRLVLQLLIYPITDRDFATASYRDNAEGYGLTRADMEYVWRHYLRSDADAAEPHRLAAARQRPRRPARLPWSSPPGTTSCATRARPTPSGCAPQACGWQAKRFPGLIHGFLRIAGEVDAAVAAFDEAIVLVEDTLGIGARAAGSRQ